MGQRQKRMQVNCGKMKGRKNIFKKSCISQFQKLSLIIKKTIAN